MGYVLDKGLNIGKKIVVTGFVVSSVPLLIPLLLVVSALGFIFLLPFGFLYACYACTEKFMSKLLPSQFMIDSATVPVLHEGNSESEGLNDTGTVEETQVPGDVEKDVETSLPIVVVKDDNLMENESDESEKYVANGKSVEAEDSEKLEEKEQTDLTGKISALMETEKGGNKRTWGKLKPSGGEAHAGEDEKVENLSEEFKTSSSDVVSPEVVSEENAANDSRKTSTEKEQAVARDSVKSKDIDTGSLESSTAVGEVNEVEEGKQEKKPLVLKANSENDEQSRMVSDDSEHSLDEAALVDIPELKHEESRHSKGDSNVSDPDIAEGLSEDEKIWRKIDLVREIVGFKTPRHQSYFEELKALYAFMGIELPPLVEEPSDLVEFNNKLHFLMSVIGVK